MKITLPLITLVASAFAAPAVLNERTNNAAVSTGTDGTGLATNPDFHADDPNTPGNFLKRDPKHSSGHSTTGTTKPKKHPGDENPDKPKKHPGDEDPTKPKKHPGDTTTHQAGKACKLKKGKGQTGKHTKPGKGGKLGRRAPGDPVGPGNDPGVCMDEAEAEKFIKELKAYKSGTTGPNAFIDTTLTGFMERLPKKDGSVFYIDGARPGAMKITEYPGKLNVGQCYREYSKGIFNPKELPMSKFEHDKDTVTKFWQSTSAAFARKASGVTWLVYDGDYKVAKGTNGDPTIFLTDEINNLTRAGTLVTKVIQVSTADALKYGADADKWLEAKGTVIWEKGQPPIKALAAKSNLKTRDAEAAEESFVEDEMIAI